MRKCIFCSLIHYFVSTEKTFRVYDPVSLMMKIEPGGVTGLRDHEIEATGHDYLLPWCPPKEDDEHRWIKSFLHV